MTEMTTLQLAERIAYAVMAAARSKVPYGDAPTQAVIDTLFATGSWFCRLEDTTKGTVETPYKQLDLLQD